MAKIVMDNIAHRYPSSGATDADYALQPLSMEWEDGGAYALLGPSGCGKTTLLNIISGLITPSAGRVLFNDEDVTALQPQQRNIAQVFQFPVVYETMTVAQNLDFPLKNRGIPAAERKHRVAQVLEMLELTALAGEKARNLTAASKQKISLGRGLVRTDANAVLFDEPLTVIDPALKWQLRAQLKKIHLQVGHTMIYVTHDQTEALTFAEKVILVLEGRVLQVGTPEELFNTPAHTFVGRFIGSPGMNVLPCSLVGNVAMVGDKKVALNCDYAFVKESLELGIRPEHVRLFEQSDSPAGLTVTITKIDDIGRHKIVHLMLGDQRVHAIVKEGGAIPHSPVAIFDPDHVHLYRNSVLLPRRSAWVSP
jgi:glycerol transport system ATP-binding protein